MKHPNSNLQAPENLQAPSFNFPERAKVNWMFGYWRFSGAWSLEFGAYPGGLL